MLCAATFLYPVRETRRVCFFFVRVENELVFFPLRWWPTPVAFVPKGRADETFFDGIHRQRHRRHGDGPGKERVGGVAVSLVAPATSPAAAAAASGVTCKFSLLRA